MVFEHGVRTCYLGTQIANSCLEGMSSGSQCFSSVDFLSIVLDALIRRRREKNVDYLGELSRYASVWLNHGWNVSTMNAWEFEGVLKSTCAFDDVLMEHSEINPKLFQRYSIGLLLF